MVTSSCLNWVDSADVFHIVLPLLESYCSVLTSCSLCACHWLWLWVSGSWIVLSFFKIEFSCLKVTHTLVSHQIGDSQIRPILQLKRLFKFYYIKRIVHAINTLLYILYLIIITALEHKQCVVMVFRCVCVCVYYVYYWNSILIASGTPTSEFSLSQGQNHDYVDE